VEDRRKAELDYLRYNWNAYLSASIPQSELTNEQLQVFRTLHPRYIRLLQKYEPTERGEMDVKSVSLRNTLISIYFLKKFLKFYASFTNNCIMFQS